MSTLLFIMMSALAITPESAADGFLFVTFRGEQTPMTEQIYFALSKDGRKWTALNGGKPVLVSRIGDQGVRDPYLLRSHDGGTFYLIATDLSINLNPDWDRAERAGSQSILIWESNDLTHWSGPRRVKVAPNDAGCAWAPEAIYDPATQRYLVYWASKTRRDRFAKHRIWAAWTTDFRTFSEPFLYIEKPDSVIDTTIVRGEDGKSYRFTKNEKLKRITQEVSDNLLGPWQEVPTFSLARLEGFEGPECYQVAPAGAGKPATWCLILDHYHSGKGYEPFVTQDLAGGRFTPGEGFRFPFRFRHGSVLPVSSAEYQRLEDAYLKTR